ncbi:hypothetical protein BGY98DRAFT_1103701 [Russula aff. rugulosa BPL654]|nr:hypothetical protein BGY98DRAFT_1103701 [Russula aff. rugulosa BPL654]
MLFPSVLSVALVVLCSDEKVAWLNAIKVRKDTFHTSLTLAIMLKRFVPSVNPSDIPPVNSSSSFYDDVVYIHMDLNIEIHYTGLFLPWHRWYLHSFEGALRDQCGRTRLFESSFWKDSDPSCGLGGWGDPNNDYQVPDGALSNMTLAYPSPHTVRRNFTLQPFQVPDEPFYTNPNLHANASFSSSAIQAILGPRRGLPRLPDGDRDVRGTTWQRALDYGGDLAGTCPQNAPPGCVQGATWTPNDVLFWLHHAMIDRIWHKWQLENPQNANSFSGGSTQCLDSLAEYQQFPNGCTPDLDLTRPCRRTGYFRNSPSEM